MHQKPATKNNLFFTHPAIAKEWHPSKNGSLSPRDVTLIANRKVWWLCPKDHVWAASVNERIRGSNCPVCAGGKVEKEIISQEAAQPLAEKTISAKVETPKDKSRKKPSKEQISAENCLQKTNPQLAAQWHPTKNGILTPKDITAFSRDKAWWKCPKGHEWSAPVNARNNGQGCFYCNYMERRRHH
jgi:hypothetical protein